MCYEVYCLTLHATLFQSPVFSLFFFFFNSPFSLEIIFACSEHNPTKIVTIDEVIVLIGRKINLRCAISPYNPKMCD